MSETTLNNASKKHFIRTHYPVLLFAFLAAVLLYVFFVAPITVTEDGYSHLYGGQALRLMFRGQPEAHSIFSYNSVLLPNWLCALLLAALSTLISNEIALPLLTVLSATALITGLYSCIDATLYNRRQRAQVLVVLLPFALNAYLTKGFYGFLISSSICIFVLGLLLRHGLKMPLGLQCVTACLLLGAYFAHPLPVIISFLFPCAYFIAGAIIHWQDGWRRSAAALKLHAFDIWPWMPVACLLPWFYLRLSTAGPQPEAPSITFTLKHRAIALARDALVSISPTAAVGTLFIALLSILLAGAILCPRTLLVEARLRFTSLTVLMVSTAVFSLIVPDQVGDGSGIGGRLLLQSVIFLVLLALTSGVVGARLLTLCSLVAAVSVLGFAGEYLLVSRRLAPAVAEVRSAMERVPRHSRILIMGYRMAPSSCEGWPLLSRAVPERHWALVGALKNELIVLNDYQGTKSHFPLRYLKTRPDYTTNEVDWSSAGQRAAWFEILKSDPDVDFVVSWGVSRDATCSNLAVPPFEEALISRYDKVFFKQGASRVELWRRRR